MTIVYDFPYCTGTFTGKQCWYCSQRNHWNYIPGIIWSGYEGQYEVRCLMSQQEGGFLFIFTAEKYVRRARRVQVTIWQIEIHSFPKLFLLWPLDRLTCQKCWSAVILICSLYNLYKLEFWKLMHNNYYWFLLKPKEHKLSKFLVQGIVNMLAHDSL